MAVITYPKWSTARLSKNFTVREFRCGLGRPCNCSTTLIDSKLVEILQKIRDHFGVSVTITSGYRCPAYNKSIGGATGSRHSKGQAADIVVDGVAPRKVAAYAESIGVKGIGLYETEKDGYFVHVDTRETKTFWYGQAQAYRSTFGGASAAGTPAKPSTGTTTATGYTRKDFITDVQKACGANPDGLAGPETLRKAPTISAKVNPTHKAVETLQRYLLALGYEEVGKADGHAGPKFTSALAHYQQDNGCIVDGEATNGGKTWAKLLGLV